MKCFAYLRVSSLGQVQGDGYDRQLLACEAYAAAHGLEIVEVFRESMTGTSDLEDRPALAMLLAALEMNGVKTVIVEKLDRVARDLLIQETIIGDMQKRGYILISTMEPDLCSNDPSRVLVRQIFGAIAEYDRKIIVAKTRAARERIRAKQGKCEGRHAYGDKPGEAEVLAEMRRLAENLIPRDVCAQLNQSGYRTRYNKPWHPSTVAKILSR